MSALYGDRHGRRRPCADLNVFKLSPRIARLLSRGGDAGVRDNTSILSLGRRLLELGGRWWWRYFRRGRGRRGLDRFTAPFAGSRLSRVPVVDFQMLATMWTGKSDHCLPPPGVLGCSSASTLPLTYGGISTRQSESASPLGAHSGASSGRTNSPSLRTNRPSKWTSPPPYSGVWIRTRSQWIPLLLPFGASS